jgi:hypothetical protein
MKQVCKEGDYRKGLEGINLENKDERQSTERVAGFLPLR